MKTSVSKNIVMNKKIFIDWMVQQKYTKELGGLGGEMAFAIEAMDQQIITQSLVQQFTNTVLMVNG